MPSLGHLIADKLNASEDALLSPRAQVLRASIDSVRSRPLPIFLESSGSRRTSVNPGSWDEYGGGLPAVNETRAIAIKKGVLF